MILSDHTIREEVAAGRIVIEPFDDSCVQPSSVDLHVDRFFRVFRNHTQRVIDVKEDQVWIGGKPKSNFVRIVVEQIARTMPSPDTQDGKHHRAAWMNKINAVSVQRVNPGL